MEAILKNQLRHVSLAVSFTSSTVNESEETKRTNQTRARDSDRDTSEARSVNAITSSTDRLK